MHVIVPGGEKYWRESRWSLLADRSVLNTVIVPIA